MKYTPIDTFSATLLASIPKKMLAWMDVLFIEGWGDGQLEHVSWSLDGDHSTITDSKMGVTISWGGAANEPEQISSNSPRLVDIASDLEYFTALEKSIYDVFQECQDAILDAADETDS